MLPQPPVMLITDAAQAVLPLDEIIEQSLQAGCRWILLRDILADDTDLLSQAERIKKQCAAYNAKLFISRNFKIAKFIGADGVHLSSQQNMAQAREHCGAMLIGQSCHNADEILTAEKNGADYVSISPVFETMSKPGYTAMGREKLSKLCNIAKIPVIALGGINTSEHVKACIGAGARGIALMGAIMRTPTPDVTLAEIIHVLDR